MVVQSKYLNVFKIIYIYIHTYIHTYINNIHSNILLRCSKEIKALITARHGELIRFNLARWT